MYRLIFDKNLYRIIETEDDKIIIETEDFKDTFRIIEYEERSRMYTSPSKLMYDKDNIFNSFLNKETPLVSSLPEQPVDTLAQYLGEKPCSE